MTLCVISKPRLTQEALLALPHHWSVSTRSSDLAYKA